MIGQLLRFVIAVILAMASSMDANSQSASFPGAKSQTRSPNGRYVIRNQDFSERNASASLTLIDSKSNGRQSFYQYHRHIEVLWSPRSDAFVINDYQGSNLSTAILFHLPLTANQIDLGHELDNQIHSLHQTPDPFDNLHVYLVVEKWLDSRQLLCKLWGYGEANPRGFTRYFVYEIGKGFREIHKHSDLRPSAKSATRHSSRVH